MGTSTRNMVKEQAEQEPQVRSLIASAALAEELIPYEELEEHARDHMWSCNCCNGLVYSMGILGKKEWGRCRACGMDQWREDNGEEETG